MPERKNPATSKAAHNYIKPHKPSHRERILEGLKFLRVGGTYEEIARATGMREDQVWKRLSECSRAGLIFDTGITRKLKSSLQGTVWQLTDLSKIDNSPRPLPPITHNLQLQLL